MTTPSYHQIRAMGIPWYRKEDYPKILKIMSDGKALPRTWTEWSNKAEQLREKLVKDGVIVETVLLDPDEFPGWCKARGLDVNSQARTAFANEAVARKHAPTH